MALNYGTDITRDKQAEIDKHYAETRRTERLTAAGIDPKGKGKAASNIDTTKLPGAKAQAQAKEVFVPPNKEAAAWLKDPTPPPPSKAQQEAELKQKMGLIRIYNEYYAREATAVHLPPPLKLSLQSSLTEIQAALYQVRQSLNSANSDAAILKMYPTAVDLLIKLLVQFDLLETLGLEGVEGCGQALEVYMGSPAMQTEITEMQIELQGWFSASWHSRLALKTFMFMKAFAAAKKAATRPAPPMSAATAAALS